MKRREFIKNATVAGFGLGTAGLSLSALAATKYNVVVVGGGMSGAAVAKYIRLWSQGLLSVAIIERDATYTSNIMSNEVLTGKRSLGSLAYGYGSLTSKYGITRITGRVSAIDAGAKTVSYDGGQLAYDRLVLAPGLEFDLMPGMTSATEYDSYIPHAWKAGAQTTLLRSQLVGMPDGGNVVITIPLSPYRCPPGPYERACVIADWLRVNKPNSKLIVLDANAEVQAQKANFMNAFNGAYGYRVDYRPNSIIDQISDITAAVKTVQYNGSQTVQAAVLNPIPPQRAPALLASHGLLNGRFAPVKLLTYESTLVPGVHVIGDACVSGMPKAGHIGNQEGKTCANAIVADLLGSSFALPNTAPVLNSACFTPVNATMATWLSAVYQYNAGTGAMAASTYNGTTQPQVASAASADTYSEMNKWFNTLMGDTFA